MVRTKYEFINTMQTNVCGTPTHYARGTFNYILDLQALIRSCPNTFVHIEYAHSSFFLQHHVALAAVLVLIVNQPWTMLEIYLIYLEFCDETFGVILISVTLNPLYRWNTALWSVLKSHNNNKPRDRKLIFRHITAFFTDELLLLREILILLLLFPKTQFLH